MLGMGATFTLGGVLVGRLTSISLPDRSRDEVDDTDMSSGGDMEFIPGLRDGGSVTLEGRLATGVAGDAGMDAIESNYAATGDAAIAEMVISLPDKPATGTAPAPTTYTFDGFVTEINGDIPFDDQMTFSVTVKVSGAVVKAKAKTA